jgi:hypothetical protein
MVELREKFCDLLTFDHHGIGDFSLEQVHTSHENSHESSVIVDIEDASNTAEMYNPVNCVLMQ